MASHDRVLNLFLERQREEGMALAADSDLVELTPLGSRPATATYLAHFHCKGLVRGDDGVVREADHFEVGYWFSREYLRYVDERKAVSWLHPLEIYHPNVNPPCRNLTIYIT